MSDALTNTPDCTRHFVNGVWQDPLESRNITLNSPVDGSEITQVALGGKRDVDRAVAVASAAFETFCTSTKQERLDLLHAILQAYDTHYDEFAKLISLAVAVPYSWAHSAQAYMGQAHLKQMIESLNGYEFEHSRGTTRVRREGIGVVAMITPWNWPINQIICKVAPALAAGCTMILKPSELAPLSAHLFAEVMAEAGVPAGVFNMLHGTGETVGTALSRHPGVAMVSFTGSTRAGVEVAKNGAETIKRIHQELGGKSANILLPDVDLEQRVKEGVLNCFNNNGQSCNAPTRMLVHESQHDEAASVAKKAAEEIKVGDPVDPDTEMGPVISNAQFEKIQGLIQAAIEEGAKLETGGLGHHDGLNGGGFVRPTIFSQVDPDMTIAKAEVFGPVLSIIPYHDEDHAVEIANSSEFGLAGYVQSGDQETARRIANKLRAGTIFINNPAWDSAAPFGGYKQSGNGREYADFAIDDFTEIKGIVGHG